MAMERMVTQDLTVYCNGCAAVHIGTGNFYTTLVSIKEQGWKAINRNNGWEHYCPACQGEL